MNKIILIAFMTLFFFSIYAEVTSSGNGSQFLPDNGYELIPFTSADASLGAMATRTLSLQIEQTAAGSVRLYWTAEPGATFYLIYHSDTIQEPGAAGWTLLKKTLQNQCILDTTVARGFFYITSQTEDLGNFKFVEGGTFNNGSSNVTVSSFLIDKYELTQSAYQAVMGVNPSWGYGVGSSFPVYFVSWFNALVYCNLRSMAEGLTPCYSYGTYGTDPGNWPAGWNVYWQNHVNVSCDWNAACYRLPTEMEWMYAAKGGGLSANYIYSGSNNIDEVGWCYENWGQFNLLTKPVGGLAPNELGAYDMSGNMWEWCWDIKGDYPAGDQTNPTGVASGTYRVSRGGSWYALASSCTVLVRGEDVANSEGSGRVGFRVVKVFP